MSMKRMSKIAAILIGSTFIFTNLNAQTRSDVINCLQ